MLNQDDIADIASAPVGADLGAAIVALLRVEPEAGTLAIAPDAATVLLDRACHLRDAGLDALFLEICQLAAERLPNRTRAVFDGLVVLVASDKLDDRFEALHLASLTILDPPPDLKILMAFGCARRGDLGRAAELIGSGAPPLDPFFARVRARTLDEVLIGMIRAAARLDVPEALVALLARHLTVASGDELLGRVAQAAFFDRFQLGASYEPVRDALFNAAADLTATGRAVAFHYFVSCGFIESATALIGREAQEGELFRQALFWKAYNGYRLLAGPATVKVHDEPIANDLFKDLLQRREVALRMTNTAGNANRPLVTEGARRRVFAGLFGQLRNQDATHRLCGKLRADAEAAGVELTIALATWDKTGYRKPAEHGGLDIFLSLLPQYISRQLQALITDANALRRHFPALYRLLCDQHGSIELIDDSSLRRQLPGLELVDIADETRFEEGLRTQLDLTGMPAATFNQFKMFDRIGALAGLRRDAGGRFDYCIVVRNDLDISAGSLIDLGDRLVVNHAAGTLLSDWDPYALFLEGIGDRYLIGGDDAIDQVFGCFEALCDEASDHAAARPTRLAGHEILGAHLYRTGIDVIPIAQKEVAFTIDRGNAVASPLVLEAILEDADAGDPVAWTLASALGPLPRRAVRETVEQSEA